MSGRISLRRAYTELHACSYLADREARMEVVLTEGQTDLAVAAWLAQAGFRRNGGWFYRPACPDCQACIPTRLPVASATLSRSQRRCLKRNRDLLLTHAPVVMWPEHHALYQRYQDGRHAGGEMSGHGPEECLRFLAPARQELGFQLEARDGDRLVGVMVLDRMQDGLSCVYSYYEPDLSERGLGTFLVLAALGLARDEGLGQLYLGYRIAGNPKMAYKDRFRPREERRPSGAWRGLP